MFLSPWRRCISSLPIHQLRHASSASRSRISIPPPFPVTESCPSPTCSCRAAPVDLDIDRSSPLNGTMAAYAEQVLLCTGKDDWKSRIDEGEDAEVVRSLRGVLGTGGKYFDPFNNVMITNSSFKSSPGTTHPSTSAYLLPSFRYIPSLPPSKPSVEKFAAGFLNAIELHQAHNVLSEEQRRILTRDANLQAEFPHVRDVNEILVLICGHGGRDQRCGILGPLLRDEFEEKLGRKGISPASEEGGLSEGSNSARVGLISHIGGHKYAGNVIIYIPPTFKDHALAGTGIWYGRVGPEHVEGIVEETVMKGKVVKDMFRGGIRQGGGLLRL